MNSERIDLFRPPVSTIEELSGMESQPKLREEDKKILGTTAVNLLKIRQNIENLDS
ncbi:MAG: hypothetical protein Q3996_02290 [Candidatus Saccharibacteria bacterium]|nr:hypothetical protein [Candidatus Saccharibacteria bacterium]